MDYVKFGNTGLDVSPLCLGQWDLAIPTAAFMSGS